MIGVGKQVHPGALVSALEDGKIHRRGVVVDYRICTQGLGVAYVDGIEGPLPAAAAEVLRGLFPRNVGLKGVQDDHVLGRRDPVRGGVEHICIVIALVDGGLDGAFLAGGPDAETVSGDVLAKLGGSLEVYLLALEDGTRIDEGGVIVSPFRIEAGHELQIVAHGVPRPLVVVPVRIVGLSRPSLDVSQGLFVGLVGGDVPDVGAYAVEPGLVPGVVGVELQGMDVLVAFLGIGYIVRIGVVVVPAGVAHMGLHVGLHDQHHAAAFLVILDGVDVGDLVLPAGELHRIHVGHDAYGEKVVPGAAGGAGDQAFLSCFVVFAPFEDVGLLGHGDLGADQQLPSDEVVLDELKGLLLPYRGPVVAAVEPDPGGIVQGYGKVSLLLEGVHGGIVVQGAHGVIAGVEQGRKAVLDGLGASQQTDAYVVLHPRSVDPAGKIRGVLKAGDEHGGLDLPDSRREVDAGPAPAVGRSVLGGHRDLSVRGQGHDGEPYPLAVLKAPELLRRPVVVSEIVRGHGAEGPGAVFIGLIVLQIGRSLHLDVGDLDIVRSQPDRRIEEEGVVLGILEGVLSVVVLQLELYVLEAEIGDGKAGDVHVLGELDDISVAVDVVAHDHVLAAPEDVEGAVGGVHQVVPVVAIAGLADAHFELLLFEGDQVPYYVLFAVFVVFDPGMGLGVVLLLLQLIPVAVVFLEVSVLVVDPVDDVDVLVVAHVHVVRVSGDIGAGLGHTVFADLVLPSLALVVPGDGPVVIGADPDGLGVSVVLVVVSSEALVVGAAVLMAFVVPDLLEGIVDRQAEGSLRAGVLGRGLEIVPAGDLYGLAVGDAVFVSLHGEIRPLVGGPDVGRFGKGVVSVVDGRGDGETVLGEDVSFIISAVLIRDQSVLDAQHQALDLEGLLDVVHGVDIVDDLPVEGVADCHMEGLASGGGARHVPAGETVIRGIKTPFLHHVEELGGHIAPAP